MLNLEEDKLIIKMDNKIRRIFICFRMFGVICGISCIAVLGSMLVAYPFLEPNNTIRITEIIVLFGALPITSKMLWGEINEF